MTDQRLQDLTEVEALLATRQQLTGWLEKLEAAGAKAPPAVRDRVRADYQGRLAQIVQQLRGHSDVISNTLQGLRAQAEEYAEFRTEERETLAEAELRYSVGEYTPEEWQRVEQDSSGKIAGLDEELERLGREIGRLEDVLTQISVRAAAAGRAPDPAARAPEPPPVRAPEPPVAREEPAPPAAAEPPAREPVEMPEAPRFVPRGGLRNSGPARTIPFPAAATQAPPPAREAASGPVDELTFIKSVSLDPPSRSAAPASSGGTVVDSKPIERTGPITAKTLKCGECGSLNRPTEWYCERCGAELAAV
jgi:hypothetical protein